MYLPASICGTVTGSLHHRQVKIILSPSSWYSRGFTPRGRGGGEAVPGGFGVAGLGVAGLGLGGVTGFEGDGVDVRIGGGTVGIGPPLPQRASSAALPML